ncbi:MAG: DUF2726 domain-containing protein [Pseudomonadota bacterium]|nr:DUF2726 domain-containing protein [Pseudomonadota bacterium]
MQWWMIVLLVAALGGAGFWFFKKRDPGASPSARNDRYAAEVAITPAQTTLLHYLQEAFPDHAVLYAQPLSSLVSVRYSEDRQRAIERMQGAKVDFVVCSSDGKPRFAFQVDAYRSDDDDAAQRDAALKNRVLGTAGVRMLRLKRSVRHMPPADEFRQRLENRALGKTGATETTEAEAQAGQSPLPMEDYLDRFGDGDSMSMTDLMGLPER